MSDDRLRRLDALFAEKVLGCPAPICACEYWPGGQRMADGVAWCCACKRPHADPYTRSLDAAWEGARQHFTGSVSIGVSSGYGPDGDSSKAHISEPMSCAIAAEALADHPAEALVLACLRAVGCSEEELA
jgi:hypothetical protein